MTLNITISCEIVLSNSFQPQHKFTSHFSQVTLQYPTCPTLHKHNANSLLAILRYKIQAFAYVISS